MAKLLPTGNGTLPQRRTDRERGTRHPARFASKGRQVPQPWTQRPVGTGYGVWTLTPVGLSPTVHASLRWTHTSRDRSAVPLGSDSFRIFNEAEDIYFPDMMLRYIVTAKSA